MGLPHLQLATRDSPARAASSTSKRMKRWTKAVGSKRRLQKQARGPKKQKQTEKHGHSIGRQPCCRNPKTHAAAPQALLYRAFFTASLRGWGTRRTRSVSGAGRPGGLVFSGRIRAALWRSLRDIWCRWRGDQEFSGRFAERDQFGRWRDRRHPGCRRRWGNRDRR